jgi:glycosyltransferase involved in cell wall biosynthesis
MKIALVAAGEIEIPPKGWGALETVVWSYYTELKKLNFTVEVINENDSYETYQRIEAFDPDVVHLHYGKHYEILPSINRRKIITNHDGSFLYSYRFHEQIIRRYMYDCEFSILTSWEHKLLSDIGLPQNSVRIVPNGVDYKAFKQTPRSKYSKSICLGKIDSRKNQAKLQKLNCDIVFVGQNSDINFDISDINYLGQWSRDEVFAHLTDYTNLILLSNAELQPLVCLEALSAGLGLVISEQSAQNLDCNLDFITVIPSSKMDDDQYIKNKIIENKDLCLSIDRKRITDYASTFDWSNIIKQYVSYL